MPQQRSPNEEAKLPEGKLINDPSAQAGSIGVVKIQSPEYDPSDLPPAGPMVRCV